MRTLTVRRVVFVALLLSAGAWVSINGQTGPAPSSFALTATIPIGLQPYTDLDADPATGRVYLAIRDGLRVVDTTTGEIGRQQTQLEMSGTLELAPDIDRMFAEINDDFVGFIDIRSYHLDRLVRVPHPGRLVYEPATEELYVFSAREPRVLILDGRTGDQKRVIDLPGWGGDGILKTPGRIYISSPPKTGLYVIDTEERQLTTFAMPEPLDLQPARFTLVADASGRTLFATDHFEIMAIDADTGERLASVKQGAETLMYDDTAGVLLAHLRESDWPLMKLVGYRLEGGELVRVSEQRLPREGGLYPFMTSDGFVSGFFTGSVDARPTAQFRRSYFAVWQR